MKRDESTRHRRANVGTYKSVALRAAGGLVHQHDGLEDLAVLRKVAVQRVRLGVPRQTCDWDDEESEACT